MSALRRRIEIRVDEMFDAGPARRGRSRSPRPLSRTVAQAIGVREMLAVLDGELTADDARGRMKTRTRGYVRRQLTWMRKLQR